MANLLARLTMLASRPDRGATLIEYGLLVALVTGGAVAAAASYGDRLDALYGELIVKLR